MSNTMKPGDVIQCRECGYRILYKKRTRRRSATDLCVCLSDRRVALAASTYPLSSTRHARGINDCAFVRMEFKVQPLLPKNSRAKRRDLNKDKDWNAIIRNHSKLKNDDKVLSSYIHMESLGITPNGATLPLVFKACTRLNAVETGKMLHSSIKGGNLMKDVRVGTAVVGFYCKCGLLKEAKQVFDKMIERDLVLWNAMIYGYVTCGCYQEAIVLFRKMQKEGFQPNSRTLVALLLACEGVLELRLGQEIHGYCLRNGCFNLHPHVGTALIGFYLNFDMTSSRLVFDSMVERNAVSWNAMTTGYLDHGDSVEALQLVVQMLQDGVQFDLVTLLLVIQACEEFGSFEVGKQVHQLAIKVGYSNDLFIVNALINMYSGIGHFDLACQLFDASDIYDTALCNSMIAAHIEYGFYEEATSLFSRLRADNSEDERTMVLMLSLCAYLTEGLRRGQGLHAHICKSGMKMDVSVGNALSSMYADSNCAEAAKMVFDRMTDVDVISYNTLILALSSCSLRHLSWELFGAMRESKTNPNSHTMISLLAACGEETSLKSGKSVHGLVIKYGIEVNTSLNTSLCDMYMNCGDEETARKLFEACPNRDLISWNAMIAGYIRRNLPVEASTLFNRMISEIEPNPVTIINILSTCTNLANLPLGQCLHAYAIRRFSPFIFNISLANAFITMYTRCGGMKDAEKIFNTLPKRTIVSWNAMITGYGTHGRVSDAIQTFMKMLEDGFQPNGVTFLSIISACSHAGLIEKGLKLFHSMVHDFKITPMLAHYGCVVDLLGRGGCLDEAREFVSSMPIEPDASVWRALLSACRVHSDTKLAAAVFQNIVELEPANAGNYVLLSNIYAAAGFWSEVREIRTWLKEKSLKKTPGNSWIVIRGQVHSFAAGDTSHSHSQHIYATLSSLLVLLREFGYVTDTQFLLHDQEED
ncbi:hypothetical protein Tsubulata_012541 [Turnera subulata]|uniref:Pentatricopeptide repeat-containing protein n=1 Tax=Turnera subulata TaxID=218843 RepID=A0A9Q0F5Q9_9ROSI|nr:hypothetical protein Tsubulata_012541 [Turnera subulata]